MANRRGAKKQSRASISMNVICSTSQDKINIIRSIPGLSDGNYGMDDLLKYNTPVVDNLYNHQVMSAAIKDAWHRRALFLSPCMIPGMFHVLPPQLYQESFL